MSSKGASKRGHTTAPADPYAAQAAGQSAQLWQETSPLRQQWLAYGSDLLNGGNITDLPIYGSMYNAAKTGTEKQYALGSQNIISQSPVGGQMYKNLSNLQSERAKTVGGLGYSLQAPIYQDFMDKVYGIVAGSPQTTISGSNAAGMVEASRYAAAQQAASQNQAGKMGMYGGLGQGIGSFAGSQNAGKIFGKS